MSQKKCNRENRLVYMCFPLPRLTVLKATTDLGGYIFGMLENDMEEE